MKTKIEQSETHICKAIFPNTLNANNTLFGGLAMKWMDEVAYITATRYTRKRMFTTKVGDIKFLKPVGENMFIDVVGTIEKVGGVKLLVKVEIWSEAMFSDDKQLSIQGLFEFAALDDKNKPQRL